MGLPDGLSWSYKGFALSVGLRTRCNPPMGIEIGSRRVSLQDNLSADDYSALMKEEMEDLAGNRLRALVNIEKNKE